MRLSPSPKSAPSLRPGHRMQPRSLPNLPCENCRGRTVRCRSTKCSRRWQHLITGRKVLLVASLPAPNRRRAWVWPRNRKAGGNRVQGIASNGRCPRLSCRDVETCTGDAPKTWPIRWRLILSAIQHNSPTALGAGFACQVRAACERVTPPALGRFNRVKREFYVFHRSSLKPRQPVRWNASGRGLPPGGSRGPLPASRPGG